MPPARWSKSSFAWIAWPGYEAAGGVVINPARAIEAAVDKFLTSAKLQAAGLLTPRTIVCQTADDAMAAFAQLGGDVVVKPLFGSEGRGITRLNDEALALRAFKMLAQLGAVLYVQEFIAARRVRPSPARHRRAHPGHAAPQPARLANQRQPRREGRAVRRPTSR